MQIQFSPPVQWRRVRVGLKTSRISMYYHLEDSEISYHDYDFSQNIFLTCYIIECNTLNVPYFSDTSNASSS